MDWFTGAGLGIFVHWDHASQQGLEVSWPLVGGVSSLPASQQVTIEQYHSSAKTFDPKAWDAPAFARLVRDTGARYAVLTSKHHAGYAMWHTRQGDFSIEDSPYGGDIVGEFCDAVRSEGLRVGLYFSLADWHHPDYPAFREEDKPYRSGQSPPLPSDDRWARFLESMFGQVRELLTGYGRIDLLWFDGGWERPAGMWRGAELVDMVRALQPEILINDRLPGFGDFRTPEQFVPPQPLPGRWEACMTMNESWGYNPDDPDYKSHREIVDTLCETVSRGGNLLLNVSPRGDGTLPPEQVERLEHLGQWMQANGESIHDTEPGLEPWQFYGPSTRRGRRVYLHLVMRPQEAVTVRGVPIRRVDRVVDLASGRELRFDTRTGIDEGRTEDPLGEVRIDVPDEALARDPTVLAVDFLADPVAR
jgi:alpha-L-fucosidase